MKLRSKIIMTVFVLLALSTAILYVLIASLPAEGVGDLEQAEAQRDGLAVRQRLASELEQLVADVDHLTPGDHAYELARAGGDHDDLTLASLTERRRVADLVLLVDRDHRLIAMAGDDNGHRQALADEVLRLLNHVPAYRAFEPVTGYLATNRGPDMVAIKPILPADGQGEPAGMAIATRAIDQPLLDDLTAGKGRSIAQVLNPAQTGDPEERAAAKTARDRGETGWIRYPEAGLITSYHALDNLVGPDELALKVTSPRRFYEHARSVHQMSLVGFVVFGILFGLFCMLLIDRLVLRRLGQLSEEVDAIRIDSAVQLRVTEEGNDELSRLASNINGMLGAIEQSRNDLAGQEAKWRALIENAPDEILILDRDGRVRFLNHDAFGYDAEELVDTLFVELLPQQSQSAFRHTCEQAWETGQTMDLEHEIVYRDQSRRWLASRVSLIHRDGEPVGLLQISNDISVQIQTQKQLKQAKNDAERANQVKTQLLANMSRDIRMPMTAIMGSAELLAADPHNENKLQNNLKVLKDSGERLMRLINDILDLARVEAGEMTIDRQPVEIPELITEIVRNMRPLADKKGLTLDLDFLTAVPRQLHTDPKRLTQIMANLISNAVRHTEQGAISVQAAVEEDAWGHPKWLSLAVKDTGVGIEPHQIERLFTDYARSDANRKNGEGTGMGLVISRKLAQLLDGRITVESEPGQGSCFTLKLNLQPEVDLELTNAPIVPTMPAADPPQEDEASFQHDVSLQGTNILVAEDMPDNQFVIRSYLEDAKVNVALVENGQQAVETVLRAAAAHEPFDLVLMDMQMPVMDGYTATREMRRLGVNIPIVALTAFAMEYDEQKCLDAGCNAYIAKPIDQHRFFSKILEQLAMAAESDDF